MYLLALSSPFADGSGRKHFRTRVYPEFLLLLLRQAANISRARSPKSKAASSFPSELKNRGAAPLERFCERALSARITVSRPLHPRELAPKFNELRHEERVNRTRDGLGYGFLARD